MAIISEDGGDMVEAFESAHTMKVLTPDGQITGIDLQKIANEMIRTQIEVLRRHMDLYFPNNNTYSSDVGLLGPQELEEKIRAYLGKTNQELFDSIQTSKLSKIEADRQTALKELSEMAEVLGVTPKKFDWSERVLALWLAKKAREGGSLV